jgi:riboflavin biosynthesis pyrimidine reductase
MYDVLKAWETTPDRDEHGEPYGDEITEFTRLWRGHDKIVYSRTLTQPATARTRIGREFDPHTVRTLVEQTNGVVYISGPELAGQALRAGLVDEVHLFVSAVIVGGGTRALPDGVRMDLALTGTETFPNGVIHLHYTRRGEA